MEAIMPQHTPRKRALKKARQAAPTRRTLTGARLKPATPKKKVRGSSHGRVR